MSEATLETVNLMGTSIVVVSEPDGLTFTAYPEYYESVCFTRSTRAEAIRKVLLTTVEMVVEDL